MQGRRRAGTATGPGSGSALSVELQCGAALRAALLEPLAEVGAEARPAGRSAPADVVVCDLGSGGPDELGLRWSGSRLLVLVDDASTGTVGELFAAGAAGVLDVRDDPAAIADGVVSVGRGYLVLPSHERRALVHPSVPFEADAVELRWLRSMASGRSVAGLADDEGCSERVMYRRLRLVYDQMRATGRDHALEVLARAKLLDPG